MKYPFTKQDGIKDCAAASMQMIIKYYNGYISIDELNELMHTDKNGTTAFDIVNTATKIGFQASGIKISLDEMNHNNVILPCIAHTIIDNKYKHYMVIYKINFKKKYLLVADPQTKIKKMSFVEFDKIYNNIILILHPLKPIIKNNQVSLGQIFNEILKKYKKEIFHLLIISLIFMFISILASFYVKIIFDNVNLSEKFISIIFVFFLFLNLLKTTANYLRIKLLIFLNQKIDVELNMDAYTKVINLPYHYFKNKTTGEMMSKLMDLDKVRDMINKVIITLFVDLPLSLISSLVLFLISKKLFIISIIFMFLYFLVIVLSKKVIKEKTEDCYLKKVDFVSLMQESINGFETVKGLDLEKKMIKKFEYKYVNYLKRIISLDNLLNFQTYIKDLLNNLSELVILFIGIILVKNNEITLGTLLAFNSMQVFFFTPIRNIIDLDVSLIEGKKALKKVYEMFKENKVKHFNKKISGSISITNLFYNYNHKKVLKSINVDIKKGEKIIILGESGSGKSTLLKIIMGYLDIGYGKVKFDGTDINEINNLKDSITYICQNEVLFTDTVYNNICIYKNNDVESIIHDCYVDEIIKNDALGYNMILEENGFNISGGQRQRIVLARALMKQFNILLIDEGLNQIDINLERKILKNIFKRFKDKTIIVVSHRKENIDLFDRLIEIREGSIIKDIIKNV